MNIGTTYKWETPFKNNKLPKLQPKMSYSFHDITHKYDYTAYSLGPIVDHQTVSKSPSDQGLPCSFYLILFRYPAQA